MKNQQRRKEYLALAEEVIDNNGTLEQVRRQIARLLGSAGTAAGLLSAEIKKER